MKRLRFIGQREFFIVGIFLLMLASCSPPNVFAQDRDAPDENSLAAPPPLLIISKEEKKQLEAETDIKRHTNLALEFMQLRLKEAENSFAQKQYEKMFGELGDFQALIARTLDFLNRNNDGRGKILDNFKKLEINLRTYMPRLELIRRELPPDYEPYVRSLIKNVREARSEAVEPFFSTTIVNDH